MKTFNEDIVCTHGNVSSLAAASFLGYDSSVPAQDNH